MLSLTIYSTNFITRVPKCPVGKGEWTIEDRGMTPVISDDVF